MKKIKFNLITKPAKQIYIGRGKGCIQGVNGHYFRSSVYPIGSDGFNKTLNRIRKINPDVLIYDDMDEYRLDKTMTECPDIGVAKSNFIANDNSGCWINYALPDDKIITVYYEEGVYAE